MEIKISEDNKETEWATRAQVSTGKHSYTSILSILCNTHPFEKQHKTHILKDNKNAKS